jgi:hypothetical protein
MTKKPDLAASLAESAGSTRRKPAPAASSEPQADQPPSRGDTAPITVRGFPREVRDLLKIMAIEQKTTMENVVADAFNDYFAKHGKPEICPKK